jgi:hypothetical protein
MDTEQYIRKLDNEFFNNKFRILAKDPITLHKREFEEVVRKYSTEISKETKYKLQPLHNIKRAYGIVKKT